MPTPAEQNWAALTPQDQLRVVGRLARRLRHGDYRALLGSEVTGVGFGKRERRIARRATVLRQVCLVARVNRKWTKTQARKTPSEWHVPSSVVATVQLDGVRRRYAIPVDVCDERATPTGQVRLRSGAAFGTATALVRSTATGADCVLSACHVVYASNAEDEFSFAGRSAGVASLRAPFGLSVENSIDAAVIAVDEGREWLRGPDIWPVAFAGATTTPDTTAPQLEGHLTLQTPRGPRAVTYVRTQLDRAIDYQDFGRVVLGELLECRVVDGQPETRAGDSGSALVSGTLLVGMHVGAKGRRVFAAPAYEFLGPRAFDPRLELVTGNG